MSKELKADNSYEILDGNDDILLFDTGNTFTVKKIKELIAEKCNARLVVSVNTKEQGNVNISSVVGYLDINKEIVIRGKDINWSSSETGIDCQFLKVGSKGWQKGRLKIDVNRVFRSGEVNISLRFYPDELLQILSPLDKIRQSEEYKNL